MCNKHVFFSYPKTFSHSHMQSLFHAVLNPLNFRSCFAIKYERKKMYVKTFSMQTNEFPYFLSHIFKTHLIVNSIYILIICTWHIHTQNARLHIVGRCYVAFILSNFLNSKNAAETTADKTRQDNIRRIRDLLTNQHGNIYMHKT